MDPNHKMVIEIGLDIGIYFILDVKVLNERIFGSIQRLSVWAYGSRRRQKPNGQLIQKCDEERFATNIDRLKEVFPPVGSPFRIQVDAITQVDFYSCIVPPFIIIHCPQHRTQHRKHA